MGDIELVDKMDVPLPLEGLSSEELINSSTSSFVNGSAELNCEIKFSTVPVDNKVNDDVSTTSDITAPMPLKASDLVCAKLPLDDYLACEFNCTNTFTNDPVHVPFPDCDKIPVVSQTQDDSEEENPDV